MVILLDNEVIPPGRMVFFPKKAHDNRHLDIEATGPYGLFDRGELFAIRNYDRKAFISVTVRVKEPGD